jgi:protocatechuate 3,4-dioxygenase beta subunit
MFPRRASRRDALKIIQAAGATALVGCGGNTSVAGDGTGGAGAMGTGGSSTGGSSTGGSTAGNAGMAGAGAEGGAGGGMCVIRPVQTEGPYFVDRLLMRSDIRSDPNTGEVKEGVPLRVIFRVSQLFNGMCTPLVDALVDLWQCDALGVYGDVLDGAGQFDTRGQLWLRGVQPTNAEGVAEFLTIYPGWYTGRTVHLHFKVRTLFPETETTSQLYFDEAVNDAVMAQAPYDSRGARSTSNALDSIFLAGGADLVVPLEPDGDGYVGTFELGIAL